MKFWIIYDERESVVGCELTKRAATEKANEIWSARRVCKKSGRDRGAVEPLHTAHQQLGA